MDFVLSLLVLAAFALAVASIFVWRRGGKTQALLMLLLAVIGLGNVLIWTVPDAGGIAPADRLAAEATP